MEKNVIFNKMGDEIVVLLAGERFDKTLGHLKFDDKQDAWVYWFESTEGAEGVTYFKSLEETKSEIKFEIEKSED